MKKIILVLLLGMLGCTPVSPESRTMCPPVVPEILAPPEDVGIAFALSAHGRQEYSCRGSQDSGFMWVFVAPDADLQDSRGKLVVHHTAGPTWQSVSDGSLVTATKVAGTTVDQSSVEWLLLRVVTSADRSGGHGVLSGIRFVQRLSTVGGIAPDRQTCNAGTVGTVVQQPYDAVYVFYGDYGVGRCGTPRD